MSIHYPEHYTSPSELLKWLYDKANERDSRLNRPIRISSAFRQLTGVERYKKWEDEFYQSEILESEFLLKDKKSIKKMKNAEVRINTDKKEEGDLKLIKRREDQKKQSKSIRKDIKLKQYLANTPYLEER